MITLLILLYLLLVIANGFFIAPDQPVQGAMIFAGLSVAFGCILLKIIS